MAVEDDSAWAEWNAAFEGLKRAHEVPEQMMHLPKNDPSRREATNDWNRARATYDKACSKIPV